MGLQHCNGHATSVTEDGTRSSCRCECADQWSGTQCDSCAPGHISYPDCKQCSVKTHCNNHAVAVVEDGKRERCNCHCDDAWSGEDCNTCAPGYVSYPDCARCTVLGHCSGHAINVTDDGSR